MYDHISTMVSTQSTTKIIKNKHSREEIYLNETGAISGARLLVAPGSRIENRKINVADAEKMSFKLKAGYQPQTAPVIGERSLLLVQILLILIIIS